MKKYLFIALFGLGMFTMSSCSNQCCTLNGVEICEDDLPSGYDGWDEYVDAVETLGGSCD